ncbi:MAG TPA: glycosyltransferase N-terminal domain-containing protein [Bacteroidales bacterium]|jgi:3-deoxy-D-manno-octulosonic-acid transferase
MDLIYDFAIRFYVMMIRLAALFKPKAWLWVKGRKNIFERIKEALEDARVDPYKQPIAWFHCASLGEFEQGRPVIEAYRQKFPNHKIFLTFFSPSGYEVRKAYLGADFIFYMPADVSRQVRKFLALVNPRVAIFVKYEFWFNYLHQLREAGIPTFVISANFRPDQHFFKWYGDWSRTALEHLTHLFVQNESSLELLSFIGINHVTVSGDTRFDRVMDIAAHAQRFPLVESFTAGNYVLVAGSTWPADEELIFSLIQKPELHIKLIIAPHETHPARINALMARAGDSAIRYSTSTETNITGFKVLIIDSIGMLSALYRYATIAYIGGGFGTGIHNTLEAATFGKPVIFGPIHSKFPEARELLELGAAFSIKNEKELLSVVELLINDSDTYATAAQQASDYVKARAGATRIILQELAETIH